MALQNLDGGSKIHHFSANHLGRNKAMTSRHTLVQLFNARSSRDEGEISADMRPNHQFFEYVFSEAGFEVDTVPAYDWPWNPAARMHNAYLGLDPLRALRILLTHRSAAIVCAHLESALLLLLLRRLLRFRPPVVIWEVPWSPGWTFREVASCLAIPRADCCVVFSSNQVKMLQARYGRKVNVAFVRFCIDTNFYRPLPGRLSNVPLVLSTGLDPGRDYGILLDIAPYIPGQVLIKTGRDVTLEPGKRGNVTISREHLSYCNYRQMYADASVVVVATCDTPNAAGVTSLMEALAMGRPVIVSDNPALRDYLPPPDAGVVIAVNDKSALLAAILDLLGNPLKAEAMGHKARAFAVETFHPRIHFEVAARLLRDVSDSAARTLKAERSVL